MKKTFYGTSLLTRFGLSFGEAMAPGSMGSNKKFEKNRSIKSGWTCGEFPRRAGQENGFYCLFKSENHEEVGFFD